MTDKPEVTQAARDAAARYYQSIRDHDYAGVVRSGRADGDVAVQAATYALTEATRPKPESGEVEEAARAISRCAFEMDEMVDPWWGDQASQPPDSIRLTEVQKDRFRAFARAALTTPSPVSIDGLTEASVVDSILRAMNAASMTSRELAKALGVTEPRVSQMLRVGSNMTLQTVEKVFRAILTRYRGEQS